VIFRHSILETIYKRKEEEEEREREMHCLENKKWKRNILGF